MQLKIALSCQWHIPCQSQGDAAVHRKITSVGVSSFSIIIPIGGKKELGMLCRIADQDSKEFLLKSHKPSDGQIICLWSWARIRSTTRTSAAAIPEYPALVCTGNITGSTGFDETPSDVLERIIGMLQCVTDKLEVAFKRAPITLTFNGQVLSFYPDMEPALQDAI